LELEEALGVVLRKRRLAMGLSQEKLALEAGIQRNYVSLLELGRFSVTIKILHKLAKVLGVNASSMIRECERVLECEQEK
jgi:transcriptional regulator with XRE-family HTH domain